MGVQKVHIGVLDCNKNASGGMKILQNSGIITDIGIMASECEDLILPFTKWMKDKFVFFKLATTLNGGTSGNITSDLAKDEVHRLRAVVDLLITGGETIRSDRPILDARRINARAPNLAIYSKHKDFDTNIACFGIPNRSVEITDELQNVFDGKKLIMIEGGINLLKATYHYLDALLLFQSTKFGNEYNALTQDYKLANARQIGKDTMLWLYNTSHL
jgi:diaminohydroxyphosphoribosylaminopyrimidine deaminase/5-amino-6-(5-phosphoribosylamino)uracil reductase